MRKILRRYVIGREFDYSWRIRSLYSGHVNTSILTRTPFRKQWSLTLIQAARVVIARMRGASLAWLKGSFTKLLCTHCDLGVRIYLGCFNVYLKV